MDPEGPRGFTMVNQRHTNCPQEFRTKTKGMQEGYNSYVHHSPHVSRYWSNHLAFQITKITRNNVVIAIVQHCVFRTFEATCIYVLCLNVQSVVRFCVCVCVCMRGWGGCSCWVGRERYTHMYIHITCGHSATYPDNRTQPNPLFSQLL